MSYQKKYFLDLLLGKVIILFLFYFSDLSDLGDTSVSGNCWLSTIIFLLWKIYFFKRSIKLNVHVKILFSTLKLPRCF